MGDGDVNAKTPFALEMAVTREMTGTNLLTREAFLKSPANVALARIEPPPSEATRPFAFSSVLITSAIGHVARRK